MQFICLGRMSAVEFLWGRGPVSGTMKWPAHTPSSAQDLAALRSHHWSHPADSRAPSEVPRPGAVIFEIGLLLGIHLAIALAVTLTLRVLSIV